MAAAYLLFVLAILDVSIAIGLTKGPPEVLALVNAGIIMTMFLILVISGSRKEVRRYSVTAAGVTIPVGRRTVPEKLPLTDILGVALYPAGKPLSLYPALVQLAVSSHETVVSVTARTESFGLGNLKDLVSRLPDEKLDSEFARAWKRTLPA